MRDDLLRGHAFLIEIDGVSSAGFSRCSGLGAERRVVSYREGGRRSARLFSDGHEPGRLLLERGLTRDRSLWTWFRQADQRDLSIVLLDASGGEKSRWKVHGAVPTCWDGPTLDARSETIALESLELTYETVEWLDS